MIRFILSGKRRAVTVSFMAHHLFPILVFITSWPRLLAIFSVRRSMRESIGGLVIVPARTDSPLMLRFIPWCHAPGNISLTYLMVPFYMQINTLSIRPLLLEIFPSLISAPIDNNFLISTRSVPDCNWS